MFAAPAATPAASAPSPVPVAPATPASVPPAAAPAAFAPPAAAAAAAVAQDPPKKKKTGLIVALVIVALVLCGLCSCGGAIFLLLRDQAANDILSESIDTPGFFGEEGLHDDGETVVDAISEALGDHEAAITIEGSDVTVEERNESIASEQLEVEEAGQRAIIVWEAAFGCGDPDVRSVTYTRLANYTDKDGNRRLEQTTALTLYEKTARKTNWAKLRSAGWKSAFEDAADYYYISPAIWREMDAKDRIDASKSNDI